MVEEVRGISNVLEDPTANDVIVDSVYRRVNSGVEITEQNLRRTLDDVAGLIGACAIEVRF
jgi:hypothetical protein